MYQLVTPTKLSRLGVGTHHLMDPLGSATNAKRYMVTGTGGEKQSWLVNSGMRIINTWKGKIKWN
jgi:hypothetical protein